MTTKSDFFSNTNPDLISLKSVNDLNDAIIINDSSKKMSTLAESSITFYKKFIQPNVIPIVILIGFIIFIIYRYMTKKQKPVKESFDPSKSINDPTQTTLNLHETDNRHEFDNVINNIIEKNEIDEILNDDSIYQDLYKPDKLDKLDKYDREIYRGVTNKFKNAQTIKMDHPYGYDNDFMEMENEMMDFSTSRNKLKIDEASSMIFN